MTTSVARDLRTDWEAWHSAFRASYPSGVSA